MEIKSNESLQRENTPENMSFGEFKAFQNAVIAVLEEGIGETTAFTKPSSIARLAYDLRAQGNGIPIGVAGQYFTDVPYPFDITELSEKQFEILLSTFGPDIARAKMVSQSLVDELENGKPLPVGGACLIETWGLHLLKTPVVKVDPDFHTQVAEELIAQAPYYTQVTGTMLLGGENHIGVMYREEYPWWERAEEYGVKDPRKKTQQAYDRMFAAVERRGQLIDPEFQLIGIPFDSLRLEEDGYLGSWMDQAFASLPGGFKQLAPRQYDPEGYLLGWVRYTYSGPEILTIVKNLARQKEIDLGKFTLHTRTKQLDHFREPTALFKSFVSLSQEEEDRLGGYAEISQLAVDSLNFNTHRVGNGFVGFFDLTSESDIVHQTIRIGSRQKTIKTQEDAIDALVSPARLSAGNLERHLLYLQQVAFSLTEEGKRTIAATKTSEQLITQTEEIDKQRMSLQAQQVLEQLFAAIGNPRRMKEGAFLQLPDGLPVAMVLKGIELFAKTKKMQRFFQKNHIIQNTQDAFLRNLIQTASRKGKTLLSVAIPSSIDEQGQQELVTALVEAIPNKITDIQQLIQTKETVLSTRKSEFVSQFGNIDTSLLQGFADLMPRTLSAGNNPLVAHAIQLSFDPDMRQFVIDAQALSTSTLSEDEKSARLTYAMQQIFPKITAYLTFIMKGGVYPTIRFKSVYESVL